MNYYLSCNFIVRMRQLGLEGLGHDRSTASDCRDDYMESDMSERTEQNKLPENERSGETEERSSG